MTDEELLSKIWDRIKEAGGIMDGYDDDLIDLIETRCAKTGEERTRLRSPSSAE